MISESTSSVSVAAPTVSLSAPDSKPFAIKGETNSCQSLGLDISDLSGDEILRQTLLKQIEYYFSRKNLSTDAYLVSQMNAELYVPISTVASFSKIQALTTDENLLLTIMKSSPQLIVDQEQKRVRPNFQLQRNTIILRDIPTDADPSAVLLLFSSDTPNSSMLPKVKTIKPDIGNTWFVSFESEAEAVQMLQFVKANRNWNGLPIAARLKSESLLKGIREGTTGEGISLSISNSTVANSPSTSTSTDNGQMMEQGFTAGGGSTSQAASPYDDPSRGTASAATEVHSINPSSSNVSVPISGASFPQVPPGGQFYYNMNPPFMMDYYSNMTASYPHPLGAVPYPITDVSGQQRLVYPGGPQAPYSNMPAAMMGRVIYNPNNAVINTWRWNQCTGPHARNHSFGSGSGMEDGDGLNMQQQHRSGYPTHHTFGKNVNNRNFNRSKQQAYKTTEEKLKEESNLATNESLSLSSTNHPSSSYRRSSTKVSNASEMEAPAAQQQQQQFQGNNRRNSGQHASHTFSIMPGITPSSGKEPISGNITKQSLSDSSATNSIHGKKSTHPAAQTNLPHRTSASMSMGHQRKSTYISGATPQQNRKGSQSSSANPATLKSAPRGGGHHHHGSGRNFQPIFTPESFPTLGSSLSSNGRSSLKQEGKAYSMVAAESSIKKFGQGQERQLLGKKPNVGPEEKQGNSQKIPTSSTHNARSEELSLAHDLFFSSASTSPLPSQPSSVAATSISSQANNTDVKVPNYTTSSTVTMQHEKEDISHDLKKKMTITSSDGEPKIQNSSSPSSNSPKEESASSYAAALRKNNKPQPISLS